MRKNGFTLIELMVVLAIIMILATASVPQIQLWTARNRGATAVSQIISDFSKAKSIAAYSVGTLDTTGATGFYTGGKYTRVRPETAIMFRTSSYSILQRTNTAIAWQDTPPLKRTALPLRVSVVSINAGPTNDSSGASATLILTSTGRVKKIDNSLVQLGASMGAMKCGDVDSPLNNRRVFGAIMKSDIDVDGTKALWYQVEIDTAGEIFVCVEPSSSGQPNFQGAGANVLEI